MIKTTIFKIQLNCPGCNMYHTVTKTSGMETCQNCGKNIQLSELFGPKLMGGADLRLTMNAFLTGTIQTMGGKGVDHLGGYKLGYTSAEIYCEECHTDFNEEEVLGAINNQQPLVCNKCNHPMPVKKAEPALLNLLPKAIGVINDSSGVEAVATNTEREQVIVFGCMTCGSGLQLSKDTGRTAKCSACGNENYLPDMIWNKLHPSKDVSPLFIVFDIGEADMQETLHYYATSFIGSVYKHHFKQFVEEYFGKPFESEALNTWFKLVLSAKNDPAYRDIGLDVEKLQELLYQQILLGYENHPISLRKIYAEFGNDLPENLQSKMAEDKVEEVRLALSKNKSLNRNARKTLENDSSKAIKEETAKNKKGFFGKLFG